MANFCMHKSSISSSRKILHCLKRELEFPFSWMGVFSLPTWFIGALMFNKRDIQSHSPWLAFLLLAHPKRVCYTCNCLLHISSAMSSKYLILTEAELDHRSPSLSLSRNLPFPQDGAWTLRWIQKKPETRSCHFALPLYTLPIQFFTKPCWFYLKFILEIHKYYPHLVPPSYF